MANTIGKICPDFKAFIVDISRDSQIAGYVDLFTVHKSVVGKTRSGAQ
jgi:hypothetical protein